MSLDSEAVLLSPQDPPHLAGKDDPGGMGRVHPSRWYVIRSKPRQDARALTNLLAQGYVVYQPLIQIKRMRRGKLKPVSEPLFPGYMFISLNTVTDNWTPIRSTWGVLCLLRFGLQLATLPESIIATMRKRAEDGDYVLDTSPRPGQSVRVIDGPFAGLEAVYAEPDGEKRAIIFMNFMERQQRISVPIEVLA